MNSLNFNLADIKHIKWSLVMLLASSIIAFSMEMIAEYFFENSLADLRVAQANYSNTRNAVDLIEEEEAMITEFIDRYKDLSRQGIVSEQNRLFFRERMAQIRSSNNLFPMTVVINEQQALDLHYDPQVLQPGEPIDLNWSNVQISFPLLHEEDMTRLIASLLNSPGLYQTESCNIKLQDPTYTNYIVLGQHMTASCSFNWYTFDLDPPQEESPYGF